MKKVEKFFFFYSILATTVIFVASAIFFPSPQSLITSFALFPLLAYFWIRLTSPQDTSLSKWSARLFLSIGLLALLGIYGMFLANLESKQQVTNEPEIAQEEPSDIDKLRSELEMIEQDSSNEEIVQELAKIRAQLDALSYQSTATKTDNLSDLILDLENSTGKPLGNLKVSANLESIDVLEQADFTSSRVAEISPGTIYPFDEVSGNWYKITLPNGTTGWVHFRDIEIVK